MTIDKKFVVPEGYKSSMDLKKTEIAIKKLKDFFERELAYKLNLIRVSAPLFVNASSGLNDNLNGVERPVAFDALDIKDEEIQIVHSLAKWKRMALHRYGFKPDEGLYTDMNAIRRDEELDNIHSMYVDQWDWEKVIEKKDRTEENLKEIVQGIYEVFKGTENFINNKYPEIDKILPEKITFITTQELEDIYPNLTAKERENAITKEKGAVFLMKIGDTLASGEKHDGRAPDYDDWSLNGDILFWYPVLNCALELSSMGIRVDEDALKYQLKKANCEERVELEFHKMLLGKKLPYTVGGGIGQSRICMFFLRKAHIGEVQASIWSDSVIEECKESGITLL
ncbi:aspartate--ammonia ligase [Clostridium botulinum]|uniref:aspartate--ammonia ligase n=1 Tax=Clostridium botulinum TaxID=1491 RepID=UPI0004DAD9AB|nr:aspartate--ammonia ligase [Clostridium botulinum]KEI06926.1 asparagine synthase [Clostridium botulinum C/D str. BKT75002]KEI08222.1 asparagine synthase [Clostridium botulinum C/D str. BKT2873]MCD3350842.1 aspartate--ammonia ligase [Clostridium botulinum D/C]MCD3359863.1 aspartate--ammonia ligase [Clostridium botulinum D/C]MCD3361808.1 aspartate--ammonia ligase [Clostridium botulinum D/C]